MRFVERCLIVLVVTTVAFAMGTIDAEDLFTPREPLVEITQGWYRLEDGKKIPVQVPGTVKITGKEDLVIYNDSLTKAAENRSIYTRGAIYRLKIILGDQVLYAYDDSSFPRNGQMRAKIDCIAMLPHEIDSQTLTLMFENPGDGVFRLENVYLGMSSAVFRHQCAHDAFNLMSAFTMVILSIITMAIALYLEKIHMRDKRFRDISLFLLLCALWCTMDASIVQQISGMSPVPCYLAFYALMALGIPMLHFVQHTGNMQRFVSIRVWTLLFYVNIIAQSILHIFRNIPMIDMLIVTHVLLGGGCGWLLVLMLREYRATYRKDLFITLLGVGAMVVCGMIAMGLYWTMEISFYGLIFELGILILIACLLVLLVSSMGENLRFRIEAMVYKRLSQQDRLTGLANRRSFDEFLVSLERDADKYEDVALIFLDLNWLKYTNDHYGHNAGDELIISASRCIEHTFSPLGSCYRIGGDEFAVIITNPREDEVAWDEMIDAAIQRHNADGKYRLSIARGSSRLRDADGQIKRLSDWKYEADQAMYRCKRLQKQIAHEEEVALAAAMVKGGERHA